MAEARWLSEPVPLPPECRLVVEAVFSLLLLLLLVAGAPIFIMEASVPGIGGDGGLLLLLLRVAVGVSIFSMEALAVAMACFTGIYASSSPTSTGSSSSTSSSTLINAVSIRAKLIKNLVEQAGPATGVGCGLPPRPSLGRVGSPSPASESCTISASTASGGRGARPDETDEVIVVTKAFVDVEEDGVQMPLKKATGERRGGEVAGGEVAGGEVAGGEVVGGSAGSGGRLVVRGAARCA